MKLLTQRTSNYIKHCSDNSFRQLHREIRNCVNEGLVVVFGLRIVTKLQQLDGVVIVNSYLHYFNKCCKSPAFFFCCSETRIYMYIYAYNVHF